MKVVFVILAVIAVGFVAVVVYGVRRDQPPAHAEKDCVAGPPKMDGDEPDEDALEDWCTPNFGAFADKVRNKFGPDGIKVENPRVEVGGLNTATRTVERGDEKQRLAKFALVSGDSAKVTAIQSGEKDHMVCLCKPKHELETADFQGCNKRWLEKQSAEKCEEDADKGSLAFGPKGGTLSFESARSAVVQVGE